MLNVVLRTHDERKHLALLEVERYSDASGYCAFLEVRSDNFAGRIRFCFEVEPLRAFIDGIERMDRELAGTATLQSVYEEPWLKLEVDHAGRVSVTGELVWYVDYTHRLRFGFQTDQTCLGPFARDLRACLRAPTV